MSSCSRQLRIPVRLDARDGSGPDDDGGSGLSSRCCGHSPTDVRCRRSEVRPSVCVSRRRRWMIAHFVHFTVCGYSFVDDEVARFSNRIAIRCVSRFRAVGEGPVGGYTKSEGAFICAQSACCIGLLDNVRTMIVTVSPPVTVAVVVSVTVASSTLQHRL